MKFNFFILITFLLVLKIISLRSKNKMKLNDDSTMSIELIIARNK